MIELRDVGVELGGATLLRGVSLAVPAGARLGVIGPAAAGKSVLVKVMAGLIPPTTGRLIIDGTDVTGWSEEKLAPVRARIGMLFQNYALYDFLDVAGNVGFPLAQRGLAADALGPRVLERLRAVGLAGSEFKQPSQLSGGMKKRAGIARATIAAPALVLYESRPRGRSGHDVEGLTCQADHDASGAAVVVSSGVAGLVTS
jgi:phospholipid/cholesterol/gamma-HCH transport system ATP-binding protein